MLTTISFTADEIAQAKPLMETITRAGSIFREAGTLILENVFPPALIHSLNIEFQNTYKNYFTAEDSPDALSVGNKRKMITVPIEGAFNNPTIYGNPLLLPIIKEILGDRIILNGHGAVAAMPGSDTQHTHRDYTGLFLDDDIDSKVPTFAVTAVIPLIPIDDAVGGTRVWPGSHNATESECASLEYFDPTLPLGSCLLMDYMLVHAGQTNRSEGVRPILYNMYSRPWFRDDANYVKQRPLQVSDIEYQRIPPQFKSLFSWARQGMDEETLDPSAPCPCGSGRAYQQCHGTIF